MVKTKKPDWKHILAGGVIILLAISFLIGQQNGRESAKKEANQTLYELNQKIQDLSETLNQSQREVDDWKNKFSSCQSQKNSTEEKYLNCEKENQTLSKTNKLLKGNLTEMATNLTKTQETLEDCKNGQIRIFSFEINSGWSLIIGFILGIILVTFRKQIWSFIVSIINKK
jgi:hypothetical protein